MGYVYVIEGATLYKIGATKSTAASRMRALQIGSPVELRIIHAIVTDSPYQLEGLIHKRMKAKRRVGEWFALQPEDLAWIRSLGVPYVSSRNHEPRTTLRETVNAEFVRAMEEEGVTNAELARRMKCSAVNSLLMIQEKRNLQLDTVERLAKALGRRVEIVLTNGNRKAAK